MGFEVEHEKWLNDHRRRRKGERLDALKRGHSFGNQLFAERAWWQIAGHFDGLHPEYEVTDWRGRPYYVDFMWICGSLRLVIEIMDYGSHGTDRTKYRKDLNRGLYLQTQGCLILYISLDELKENPSFVIFAIRSILSPYLAAAEAIKGLAGGTAGVAGTRGLKGLVEPRPFCRIERELMRAAIRRNRVIRPFEAARELELHISTVIKHCRQLVEKGKFRPVAKGPSKRIVSYEYVGTLQGHDLL